MKIAELRDYMPNTNYIAPVHPMANLIAFGQETVDKYKGKGVLFFKINDLSGKGYIAYEINDTIDIKEVYVDKSDTLSKKALASVYEALIYSVRNYGAALEKWLVLPLDDKLEQFINNRNQSMTEQGMEDKFKWMIRTQD